MIAPPALAAGVTLGDAMFPGGSIVFTLATAAAWVFACFAWAAMLCAPEFRKRVAVLLAPAVAASTFGLVAADIPFRAAFLMSKPALTRFVESLPVTEGPDGQEQEESGPRFRLVGLYPVGGWSRDAGSAYLGIVGGGGLLEWCGLRYLTGDRIDDYVYSSARRLDDDWYVVCEDF
ncbi:hypothetical protein IMZ11_31300 [Microtetraspora sp. AC03309]|uniref:hypothetical protein n=1 Tax=Microtetraspora sp. AC03309 TaxID=2779376 RepID=UPI001E4D02A9|nr:hypothetical protein [Microtetraspora sp. AC03309]MCC5580121.1 hypothetical protein [Microtetraspora sp. AC03309]